VNRRTALLTLVPLALLSACATIQPYDYSAYREHMPRSILVLPPLNESVDVNASYVWLSTITMPVAERGYYVFPVAVVDAFMKDNGLPGPDEMHSVSPQKLREVFGADAVLYVVIEDWGQKYAVLSSNTVVRARARLVDTATGTEIWQGRADFTEGSGGGGGGGVEGILAMVISAAIEQIVDTTSDATHGVARQASIQMVYDERAGFLPGPRSPQKDAGDSR
jgi:hypothetical protein